MCANAPENVGEWTVIVERGPNPYAQYRLAVPFTMPDLKIELAVKRSYTDLAYW